jgi:hypothetical protein
MIWPLAADGALKLTFDTAGAAWVAGFRRRPSDGSLVATTSTAGATNRGGFLRAPTGELVYSLGAAALRHGFARDSAGALATVAADPGLEPQHALKMDAAGRPYATVLV